MTTSHIQAIIFDFGGVLLDWNPRNLYRHYFPNQPQAMEDFLTEINFSEWNTEQDRGRPFVQGIAELTVQFPQYKELIHAFHEKWEDSIVGEISGTVEILKRLKQKGHLIYGLSNWSMETFPLMRERYDFFKLLDDIVLSGEVKLVKPDLAIFDLTLQRIGQPASKCLFIDDAEVNIAAAQGLGINTIRFESPEQLEADLHQLNLL